MHPQSEQFMISKTQAKAIFFIALCAVIFFLIMKNNRKTPKPEAEKNEVALKKLAAWDYDLESGSDLTGLSAIDSINGHSGHWSTYFNDTLEFGVTFRKPLTEIKDTKKLNQATISFYVKSEKEIKDAMAVLTIETAEGKSHHWAGVDIDIKPGNWQKMDAGFAFKESYFPENSTMKIFIWNKGKESFSVDDLSIVFWEIN